jgi:glycosyltransferase involved in cell wall biosynthesis
MKKISVVLATFNEEENIARCLGSIKDLADEIVVVDGTSKDRTVEIAKSFGAEVIVTTNPPNFHINKQKAIDKATGDWILQLDADEVVSEELANEITSVINNQQSKKDNNNSNTNGYWMPRKNYFLGRFLMKGGQYPDYTVRLYRNGKGGLPQKDVHEQAVIEGKVGYLKEALLHYPYKNFSAYVSKWMRYNHLFAMQIEDEMKRKNIFGKIYYGVAYFLAKPAHWMLTAYGRHKGFMDGWQGFVFAIMSALRFPVSYYLYLKKAYGK